MDTKTIILVVAVLTLLLLGMVIYTSLERQQQAEQSLSLHL
jgi:hypothetical protein